MPYVGGELPSLFDDGPQAETRLVLRRMADKGGDRMVDFTVANTPIRHGNLRSSWYQLPTQRTHFGPWAAYKSGVASNVDYAPHVEHGTGLYGPSGAPYEIRPKNPGGFLKFTVGGREVFAKRVIHPGIRGQHMVAIAAHMVEAETDDGTLMQGTLDQWARAVEAHAD